MKKYQYYFLSFSKGTAFIQDVIIRDFVRDGGDYMGTHFVFRTVFLLKLL